MSNHIQTLNNPILTTLVKDFIFQNTPFFVGEVELYTLYSNSEEKSNYGLIYGFYHESKMTLDEANLNVDKDLEILSRFLHNHPKLDYFFMMPYFERDISKDIGLLLKPRTNLDVVNKL